MKKLLLITLIAASASALQARQLTPVEALNRAAQTGITATATPSRGGETQLVYTDVDAATGENGLYVFNRGHESGFIIVSADDCAEPLLGYSDAGTFDPDNIPDNLRAWLTSYTAQIAYAAANADPTMPTASASRPYRAPLGPLCKTTWNQNFPFNKDCPVDDEGNRCATGCVATALAQILKYHNWPDRGVGQHTYTTKSLNKVLSFDFGATVFDWEHMQDSYANSSNFINNNAVATLLYACGVAGNMNYTAGGSGAEVNTTLLGMINYLKIDKGASIQQRKWYTITEWEDLMYQNLAECGPIMYYGAADAYNAHEFVCDGYSKDGYFHINWGWGGMSDGYFLLTALDPELQGIGGSGGGYNLWQNAVIGIRPARETSDYAQIISCGSNLNGTGGYKMITINTTLYNESLVALNGVVFGVEIDGQYYPGTALNTPLAPGYGKSQYTVNLPELAEGTYRVRPAYRTDISDWQLTKCATSNSSYFDITVAANGQITVKNINTAINLGLKSLKLNTPMSPGNGFNVTATLTNNGATAFNEEILTVLNGGDVPVVLARENVNIEPGESYDVSVNAFVPDNVKPAKYSLMLTRVVNAQNVLIGTPVSVTITENKPVEFKIKSATVENADAVDPENVTINITLDNTGGYYYGPIAAWIFPNGMYAIESPRFMIEEGAEDVKLSFSGAMVNAEPLTKYTLNFYYYVYGGDQLIYYVYPSFTVRGETGLGQISSDSDVVALDIYTVTGTRIPTPDGVKDIESLSSADLPAGIYVISLTHSDGHLSTVKYLKK